ncbi:MAG TPA: chromate transporter [Candidatus Eubacterium pullicola]|nr:chromate transporter [Candidatus Eubacterium pullicola]
MENSKTPSLFALFWMFLKIGLFTIGGGLVMIPLISRKVVEEKKWITEEEMLDCIALGQSLPGVIAINSAAYVGYKKRGVKGGIMATLGVTVPSLVIIIALANVINAVNDNHFVQGAMVGIKACVVGLVICVAYDLGKKTLKNAFQWVMAVAAFICVAIFNVNAIIVIICAALAGIIYYNVIKAKDFEERGKPK